MHGMGWRGGLVVVIALAGLAGAACGGASGTAGRPLATGLGQATRARAAPGPANNAFKAPGPTAASGAQTLADGLPALQQRIIKSAQIRIDLEKGTFADSFQQASLVAARNGGYVASSATNESKLRSGSLVLRVPAGQFEATLADLKALGKLRSEQVSGQDVTGQVVDLQARLRNWQAQETVLLRLMRRSASIDDSIKVQRQLQDVQLNIEEIRGQLRVLSDQADLSTITVAMAEVSPVLAPARPSAPSRAWRAATHGTAVVAAAIVVGLGYMVPVLVVLVALGLLGLIGRRLLGIRAGATG